MLEYGMTKRAVLEDIFPDEVGFLLDEAEERKREMLRELIFVHHNDPNESLKRISQNAPQTHTTTTTNEEVNPILAEKSAMTLAMWAGDLNLMRRIQLYKRANELRKNHG